MILEGARGPRFIMVVMMLSVLDWEWEVEKKILRRGAETRFRAHSGEYLDTPIYT